MKNKLSKKAVASLMVVGMTMPNTTIVNAINELDQESTIIENNNESQSVESVNDNQQNVNSTQERDIIGQTQFVDENGNIKIVDVLDGTTGEEFDLNARTVVTANMVNFNFSGAGETTKYIDYYTKQEGYLSKVSAADAAYLGEEDGKVKFMISGVTGLVEKKYVEIVPQGTYYASNYEVNSKGKLYHYISNNVNATKNEGNYNYVGEGPSYLTKGVEYYSYDGHYFYSDYNTMINDYKNNTRANSINPNNPYYSYFQYLPLRSKTSYTGAQLTSYLNNKANSSESKLNNTGDIFVKYQNQYGVNALMAASFAALESGWGKSDIAKRKNNLFGLNATDNNPGGNADSFNAVDDCIMNFTSSWMSKRYLNATYSSLFRGGYFGDKASGIFGKYSSDPYEGEKCASIAENMDAGISSKDKGNYTIGIKDISSITHTSLDVLKDSNINSTKLYSTISNSSCAFIIRKKDTENGYYQVQSDSVLNNDRTNVSTNAEYDYDESYGYVNKNDLTIINNGNDVRVNQAPVIESAEVTDITADGYTVTCKITDDGGVDRVLMPTWTDKNGQDDLRWYTANKNGNTYTLKVKTSNHNNEGGTYYTHIYAYDTEEKQSKRELTISVPEKGKPEIKNVEVSTPTRAGYTVTCTVESSTAITRVLMPTWTNKNGQDDLVWHNAKVESQGNGKYKVSYTVKTSDHNNEDGRYITHIYAYNSAGKEACYQITKDIEIPENQAPVIESAEVTDITADGYTVTCKITDDGGVDRVLMPTWTDKNGQDDLRWYTANKNGNTYTLKVKTSNHNNEGGTYYTHIYAYDTEEKQSKRELTISVPEKGKPEIKNVEVSTPTRAGYTVTCTVESSTAITRVLMPTWTNKNGQDDLVWHNAKVESQGNGKYKVSYTVKTSDHNNEDGRYITHIYAYNSAGKEACYQITKDIEIPENQAPVIESAEVTDVNRKSFEIKAHVTDDSKVDRVLAAVWTDKNGQDDLRWYTLQNDGGLYYLDINMNEHNYETGSVNVHVYAYDDEGKQTKKELLAEIPQNQAPVITNVAISDITNDSYKITCNVSDDLQVTSVKMPTWTENGGQDDIVWHEAEVNNGVATFTVNRKDHNFEYGNYITHIYAYDAEGLTGSEIGGTITLKEPEDGKPVIKNVYITDANDDGFTITCEVTAKDGIRDVLIPTWTYKSGQDDIIWHKANNIGGNKYSCRILRKDHKSEFGAYVSHIYAYTTTNVENHIELNYHNIVNTTVAQGWTYINGEKYFFDNKGNMVGNMPCKKVVDISSYNGDIDWETAVKYGDIDGVIIRIVNHHNGSYQEDPKFARNLEACRRYNIPFGVYIYDYSHSTGDAYNEAELVMSILRKYNVSASELKYNIYFDMERNQNSTGLNSQQMSDIAATFINRISNYGYRAYIYSYRSLLNEYLNTPYIWSQTNWLAAYTNTMGWSNPYYHGSFGWQYTSGGVIPGFNGNNGYVDVSCWFEI